MRERIKDVLVDQMLMIHGSNHEGWWTEVLTPEQITQVDFKNPAWLAAPQVKPSTCGK